MKLASNFLKSLNTFFSGFMSFDEGVTADEVSEKLDKEKSLSSMISAAVNDKMGEMTTQVNEISAKIVLANDDITRLNGEKAVLESKVSAYELEIVDLKSQNSKNPNTDNSANNLLNIQNQVNKHLSGWQTPTNK